MCRAMRTDICRAVRVYMCAGHVVGDADMVGCIVGCHAMRLMKRALQCSLPLLDKILA